MAEQALEVHRSLWRAKDLALLCGIANAGGGHLIITPEEKSRARSVRKMHRAFEEIPALTLQAFGFSCSAEPIMDGPQLCLQVVVPAASEPLALDGDYYLYGSNGNELLRGSALEAFLAGNADDAPQKGDEPLPPPQSSSPSPAPAETGFPPPPPLAAPGAATSRERTATPKARQQPPAFKDRSIAAERGIYLTNTEEYVLKILNANGRATAMDIATLLGVSESTVRRAFRHLREEDLITRIGSDKAGYWQVLI